MVSPNDIQSLDEDWGCDERDSQKRPFSMRAVQKYLKRILADNAKAMADLNWRVEELENNSASMHDFATSDDVMNSLDDKINQERNAE